jgi:hypothetical protein
MNETVVAPTTDAAPVVTIGANFSGPNFHTDPGIAASPPDTDGAVGPNSFVELLNNLYQVYDKWSSPPDLAAAGFLAERGGGPCWATL